MKYYIRFVYYRDFCVNFIFDLKFDIKRVFGLHLYVSSNNLQYLIIKSFEFL